MAKAKKRENSDSRIASLKLQDKEYNEMYRRWRIEHKNDYGFFFLDRSDELIYRDGEGFITESPKAAERNAVSEISTLIANFLIFYTVLNIIVWAISKIAPMVFDRVSVFYDSFGFFTGNETGALTTTYLVHLGKRIIPILYLVRRTRMPLKVFMPTKIYNKPLFYAAVPMALLIFGVCTMLSALTNTEMALMGLDPSVRIWMPQNPYCMVMSGLLTVVAVPLMDEIVIHGMIMQVLKQFGDGFALVVTSFIASLVSGNYRVIMFTFVMYMITGYFFLRSGSLVTAFIMRIVIQACSYFLTFLRYTNITENSYMNIMMGFVIGCLVIGLAGVIHFIMKHSNKINLPVYNMYLSDSERIMCCLSNPSVIIWLSLTLTYMIVGSEIL